MNYRTYHVKDEHRREIAIWCANQFGSPCGLGWGGSYPLGPAYFQFARDDWATLFMLAWSHMVIHAPHSS